MLMVSEIMEMPSLIILMNGKILMVMALVTMKMPSRMILMNGKIPMVMVLALIQMSAQELQQGQKWMTWVAQLHSSMLIPME
jgi:hypothetical protein